AVVFLVQALNVLNRSAFLDRSYTDLGVYLTAAWAVRNGDDLYSVTDTNGWHYVYPPLFAILMTPLAHPPADQVPPAAASFAVCVVLWYAFSVLCLCLAVHALAGVLERVSGRDEPAGTWRSSS